MNDALVTRAQAESCAAECVLRALYYQRIGLLQHGNRMRYRVLVEQSLYMAEFWTRQAVICK